MAGEGACVRSQRPGSCVCLHHLLARTSLRGAAVTSLSPWCYSAHTIHLVLYILYVHDPAGPYNNTRGQGRVTKMKLQVGKSPSGQCHRMGFELWLFNTDGSSLMSSFPSLGFFCCCWLPLLISEGFPDSPGPRDLLETPQAALSYLSCGGWGAHSRNYPPRGRGGLLESSLSWHMNSWVGGGGRGRK